jgi:hypothetical protein
MFYHKKIFLGPPWDKNFGQKKFKKMTDFKANFELVKIVIVQKPF